MLQDVGRGQIDRKLMDFGRVRDQRSDFHLFELWLAESVRRRLHLAVRIGFRKFKFDMCSAVDVMLFCVEIHFIVCDSVVF